MKYLSTDRLYLRAYELSDEKEVYQVINTPGIFDTTIHIPYPYPKEQVKVWLHFTMKNCQYKKGYEYGIFTNEGRYIGNMGIVNIDWGNNSGEITYFIGEHYWGCGYATEALQAMLTFGFESLQLERIQGRCIEENRASLRVMQKCGFSYEGLMRHQVIKCGKYLNVWQAAILKEDYYAQKRKERL